MLQSMIFLCVCVELLISCHIRGPKPPRHVPPPKKNKQTNNQTNNKPTNKQTKNTKKTDKPKKN